MADRFKPGNRKDTNEYAKCVKCGQQVHRVYWIDNGLLCPNCKEGVVDVPPVPPIVEVNESIYDRMVRIARSFGFDSRASLEGPSWFLSGLLLFHLVWASLAFWTGAADVGWLLTVFAGIIALGRFVLVRFAIRSQSGSLVPRLKAAKNGALIAWLILGTSAVCSFGSHRMPQAHNGLQPDGSWKQLTGQDIQNGLDRVESSVDSQEAADSAHKAQQEEDEQFREHLRIEQQQQEDRQREAQAAGP